LPKTTGSGKGTEWWITSIFMSYIFLFYQLQIPHSM